MAAPVEGPSAAKGKKCAPCRLLVRICAFIRHTERRLTSATTGGKSTASPEEPFVGTVPRPTPDATAATDEKAAIRAANAPAGSSSGVARFPRLLRVHEERARKLGARFGVEIPHGFWPGAGSTAGGAGEDADDARVRLQKPIRVRIRRTCHQCHTMFGPGARECAACHHIRCNACGRQPPRHGEPEMQKLAAARDARDRQAAALAVALLLHGDNAGGVSGSRTSRSSNSNDSSSSSAPLVADPVLTDLRARPKPPPFVLTVPSRTGGADLVYRKPRQRVRRLCCQCSKVFPTGRRACAGEGCVHLRCPDCPREPPSKLREDEAEGVPPPTQHRCHMCRTKYPLNAPEATVCVACAHPRCGTCPRINTPLRRSEPAPAPPAVARAVFVTPALAAPALDTQFADPTLHG